MHLTPPCSLPSKTLTTLVNVLTGKHRLPQLVRNTVEAKEQRGNCSLPESGEGKVNESCSNTMQTWYEQSLGFHANRQC